MEERRLGGLANDQTGYEEQEIMESHNLTFYRKMIHKKHLVWCKVINIGYTENQTRFSKSVRLVH